MVTGNFYLQRHDKNKNPPAKRMSLDILEIGAKGDGVASVEGEELFVPYTAPGDVGIVEARGQRGRLIELTKKGPDRVDPPCPLYGQCGGCALQHLSSDFYKAWKSGLVTTPLAQSGFDDVRIEPAVFVEQASRRRVQFYVVRKKSHVSIGFHERQSHNLVDVPHCLVLDPALQRAQEGLRTFARALPSRWQKFSMSVTSCENGFDINLGLAGDDDFGPDELISLTQVMKRARIIRVSLNKHPVLSLVQPIIRVNEIAVPLPPGGFLQASVEGQRVLIDLVTSASSGHGKIADLFAGCGTFSLPLAKNASVTAYDSDTPAIDALNAAARAGQNSGLNPVTAASRNLFERPLVADELNQFDCVVIDPPRAGASRQAKQLAQSNVPTIISVSCNPKSFVRDARFLKEGGYRLTQVFPVDQFVYSSHMEMVGIFRKEG